MILFLPIVVVTFVVIVQSSMVLAAEARLAGASREGARVAASGGNSSQITKAVFSMMRPADHKLINVETNAVDSQGDPIPLPPGSEVVVRVTVPTRDVIPSSVLCLFQDRDLVGQTVMCKE